MNNNPNRRPPDDVSSAPESGTVRDETSGNQTAGPSRRAQEANNSDANDRRSEEQRKAAKADTGEER